jgi:murein DD-endopeptidase MepM/ murein hydrolase activator NlpD
MNVLKNKMLGGISVALLPLTFLSPPYQASAEPYTPVVARGYVGEYAQVVTYESFSARNYIFYPTDGGLEHLSSGFGNRKKACGACSTYHIGADFTAGYGGAVRSVSEGVVERVGREGSSGFVIAVRHPLLGDVVTVYAHLVSGSNTVNVGDVVQPNQQIAQIGSTGVTTAPHLHLEIWVDGRPVNPVTWLTNLNALN